MAEDTAQATVQAPASPSPAKSKNAKTNQKAAANKKAKRKRISKSLAFPKHSLFESLRIPRGILEQNAGRECKDPDAAKFAGLNYDGNAAVEISSGLKYGLFGTSQSKDGEADRSSQENY